MKTTRRILAVMLTVMLVLALSAVTVSAVAGTGDLAITGDGSFCNAKVTAIQMFKETGTDKTEYTLTTGWEGFFIEQGVVTEVTDPQLSQKAYSYVLAKGEDSADLIAFAAAAKEYYTNHKTDFAADVIKTATAVATDTDADNKVTEATATFSSLDAGSYLVLPASGSESVTRNTDAMLLNVVSGMTKTMRIKSEYPTVTKEVETTANNFASNTAAGVGDTVNFKLTSKVPDMSDFDTYVFKFVDTMSDGLTGDANSVVVQFGTGADAITANKGTDYTVNLTGQVLTVAFSDLITVTETNHTIAVGTPITATYSATINENAIVGTSTNSATVQYSNNPGTDKLGESTPSITTVYTYDMIIDKYTLAADGQTHVQLANAKFAIYDVNPDTTADAKPMKLVAVSGENNTYRVTGETVTDLTATSDYKVTTPASGQITIKGLDNKTYYVKETDTPSVDYNLADTVVVNITQNGTIANYAVDGTDQGTNKVVGVLNVKGALLPTTGGIGTIIFTVLGAGVIIAGVIFTSRKKKEDK